MSDHYEALQVRITGGVQGVGFRVWTRDEALRLGLTGWVRNEEDGSVAALIAGPGGAISTMIERLRRGPPGASVLRRRDGTGRTRNDADGFPHHPMTSSPMF
jgi:acylphosphatase